MVWSGTKQEKISLNEDSLCGQVIPRTTIFPEHRNTNRQARRLAMEKKYEEAQALLEQNVLGEFTQSYLPLGELTLDMVYPEGGIQNYRRSLGSWEGAFQTAVFGREGKLRAGNVRQRAGSGYGDAHFSRQARHGFP